MKFTIDKEDSAHRRRNIKKDIKLKKYVIS